MKTRNKKPMTGKQLIRMKPSKLLRLALDDLRKVEKDDRYKVSMGNWHEPWGFGPEKKCLVCLAGAALAKSCQFPPTVIVDVLDTDTYLSDAMSALNCFRLGDVASGLYWFHRGYNNQAVRARKITLYNVDKKQFRKDMNKLVRDLRNARM